MKKTLQKEKGSENCLTLKNEKGSQKLFWRASKTLNIFKNIPEK